MFSGGIKCDHWQEIGQACNKHRDQVHCDKKQNN